MNTFIRAEKFIVEFLSVIELTALLSSTSRGISTTSSLFRLLISLTTTFYLRKKDMSPTFIYGGHILLIFVIPTIPRIH